MIEVKRYTAADKGKWNEFLDSSRTPCFLFSRNFMEYHSDRFTDHSLLIFDNDRLSGIFPANIKGQEVHSHGGLTFGGMVVPAMAYSGDTLKYLSAILIYLSQQGIKKIFLKQPPVFYNTVSADEIDQAMFILDAELYRVDTAYAIDLQLKQTITYQERRKRAIKKAQAAGIVIKETNDFSGFWKEILIPNLNDRFGVSPVHSLEEIRQLAASNPGNIRQFEAWGGDRLLAGTTIFEHPAVIHAQYISAADEGRKTGAIDLLFHHLISETFAEKNIFDFGIVNEEEGRYINIGLLDWKAGFGAKPYAHRFYKIETCNYTNLEKLFNRE